MLTRIDNDADHFATLQAVDLEPNASFPVLLAALARLAPEEEEFEIIIRRGILPPSYQMNASMLARNVFGKISEDFVSYGTYTLGNQHVGIKFLRTERPERHHIRPPDRQSIMSLTRTWLDSDKEDPLIIPLHTVPSSLLARPEQFVYQVYRSTNQRIRIQKFKNHVKITLKISENKA